MNFVFLSIVCCLLLSNINYASEEQPTKKYAWPLLTALGLHSPSKQPPANYSITANSIPKNLSSNTLKNVNDEQFWASINKEDETTSNQTAPTTPATSLTQTQTPPIILSSQPLLRQPSTTTFNILTSHTTPTADSSTKKASEEFYILYAPSKTSTEKTQSNCNDVLTTQPNRTNNQKAQVHTGPVELSVVIANNQSKNESASSDVPVTKEKQVTPTKCMEVSRNSDSCITNAQTNCLWTIYDCFSDCFKEKRH